MLARVTRLRPPLPQDILRQFRSRLFDVEDKLKKDQSKKDEGTQVTLQNHNRFTVGISFNSAAVQLTKEWVEKSGQLVQELEKYRDEALRLDRLNEQASACLTRIPLPPPSPFASAFQREPAAENTHQMPRGRPRVPRAADRACHP